MCYQFLRLVVSVAVGIEDTRHVGGQCEPGGSGTSMDTNTRSYSNSGLCRQGVCPSLTCRQLPLEGGACPTCRCVCGHTLEPATVVGGGTLRPGTGHW